MARIVETVFPENAPRVDAEAGVLYGVKLLGEVSKNGRRYKPEAMKAAVPKYEGLKSYVDHPEQKNLSEDRKFKDWSGVFRNVRYESGKGIFADQHLLKTGDYFEGIVEAAQKFPTSVGYSHVADGQSRMEGAEEIIESITDVFSVDLVTDPATTAGFFESKRKTQTVKHAIESLPEGTQKKRLMEMIDAGYIDGGMSMGEEKSDDPHTQMFSVVNKVVDALVKMVADLTAAKAAIEAPVPAPAIPPPPIEDDAMSDTETETDPFAPADDNTGDDPTKKLDPKAFESLRRENAQLKARTLLLESGRDATPARIKALANVADEAERTELLESWPQLEAAERPVRSPALVESTVAADFPRDNPAKFAQMLR